MNENRKSSKETRYMCPWITIKGVRIYATSNGKKAFKIPVK